MKKKFSMKGNGKFSMKLKMLIICLSCTLFAIAAVSITTLPRIITELKESTEAHMSDFVESHADKIAEIADDTIVRLETLNHSASRIFDSYQRLETLYDQGTQTIEYQEENTKYTNSLEAFDSEIYRAVDLDHNDKVTVMLTTMSGEVIGTNDEAIIGKTLPQTQMSKYSTEEKKVTIDTTYDETTKAVTITYTMPVYAKGKVSGMVIYQTDNKVLDQILDEYTLTKIPAPRLYIINKAGYIVAHTNDSSIGNKSNNVLLNPVIEQIQKGTYDKKGAQTGYFEFEGSNVSVSYVYIPETQWLLGVNAQDIELYKDVNKINNQYYMFVAIIIIVIAFGLYFPIARFTKPIENISQIIRKIGELDFTIDVNDKTFRNIVKRRDEIGTMGQSVDDMIAVVKDRIEEIAESTEKVNEAANELKSIATDISEKADDTSATTEELSAGMEETTATTDIISSDVRTIQSNVSAIKEQISDSTDYTLDIMNRAQILRTQSIESEKNTRNTFEDIKARGAIAMEQSKATAKINEFTKVIMDIADQTSLLALNASIEAARAGDSGRGFAVVADEIGNLAKQSSDTVSKISEIVEGVNEAVSNITGCLGESQKFVEENVYKDYAEMLKILERYSEDAGSLHDTMNDINENTQTLYVTMENMTESIQGINQTIQEAAVGISDIAEKNSDIGDLTTRSNDMVAETSAIVEQLEDSVKAFKL